LYDLLVEPVRDWLEPTPSALVFVPDGVLRTIPFAALLERETGAHLIEQVPVAITPALTLTEPRPIDRQRVRVLAAGVSEARSGFRALPSVESELAVIASLFRTETLLNQRFDLEGFEAAIESAPYGIVHIASHGIFEADASQSRLLTYEGTVPMGVFTRIIGSSRYRREMPLELLSLSACETAAGDERAALGLAGAAVRVGARSALASLWSVNDVATAAMMKAFYRALAAPGVSRAEALRRAQLQMIGDEAFEHPYYWSAFILISSWL